MHDPRNIAKAYLIEGDVDLKMARLAYINSFYSRSIFFCQQASDKAVKACLVIKGVFANEHNLSSLFKALYDGKLENFDGVLGAVERLEKYGAKARFPLYQRDDLPIWIPSQSLHEDEARIALEKGELVYNRLKEYLESQLAAPASQ